MTGLKKKLDCSPIEKRLLIEKSHPQLSISRQVELLGIARSTAYYAPVDNPKNELLMRQIDEIYTECPFYGKRRICHVLRRHGYDIGIKRVCSFMRKMGIQAIYPKPHLSIRCALHKKYPYLLRNIEIRRPDHVWGTDITYIRLSQGFLYLVAIIDWFSRYVLSFQLSNSLENNFCINALETALKQSTPEIHNSDQGCQFTSNEYLSILENQKIQISMDGRGRALDNIFTERLWRSLKYEEVYIKSYETPLHAYEEIKKYFSFYNYSRPHQSLNYKTPAEIYFKK